MDEQVKNKLQINLRKEKKRIKRDKSEINNLKNSKIVKLINICKNYFLRKTVTI